MKHTATPLLPAIFLSLLLAAPLAHADYLCSYQARISGRDKFNSKGTPVSLSLNASFHKTVYVLNVIGSHTSATGLPLLFVYRF